MGSIMTSSSQPEGLAMSVTIIAIRHTGLLARLQGWLAGLNGTSRASLAPVPVRTQDPGLLSAREQGEYYLHTLTGR